MKKLILTIIALCLIATPTWAADTKLSALTELAAAPAGTDQIYINDGGVSKRITVDNLLLRLAAPPAIGGTTPAAGAFTTIIGTARISTTVTTEQLRLSYDATNYLTVTLADDGHTTIATVDPDGAEADINFTPDGNVGIQTAAPGSTLDVTGTFAVSGNATVGGTMAVTGAHTAASYTAAASANPQMLFSDSDDAAGTADIYATSSGGTNAIILTLGVEEVGGANDDYIEVDGVSETVDVLKPLVVTGYIDGGMGYTRTSTDVDVTVANNSWTYVYDHASAVNYTLPAEPEVSSGVSKVYCFRTRVAQVVTITPAANDIIELDGADETAAEAIDNDDAEAIGDFICLQGIDDGTTDKWLSWGQSGSWNGATD